MTQLDTPVLGRDTLAAVVDLCTRSLSRPPVRAHWEMLLMLAASLGCGDRNWTPSDLLRLIAKEVEGYGEVAESELEGGIVLKKGDFVWMGAP